MKTCTKEELKHKLLTAPEWYEAFELVGAAHKASVDDVVPENRIACAILANDVHSGEIANTIFAETFRVFSVIGDKDIDHDAVRKLLEIYKDCLRATRALEFRERSEDSLKKSLRRIKFFLRDLLNRAKQSRGRKRVRCLRRYVELKACYRGVEARDASVAETLIQLMLDIWEDGRSLPVFFGVAASLTELFPVSDVPDNLIASLVGLRIAARSWPKSISEFRALEKLKALV